MDNKSPKDRNTFQKNIYDVVRYRMLFDDKDAETLQKERAERKWEKAAQKPLPRQTQSGGMGTVILIILVVISMLLIISEFASYKSEQENSKTYTVKTTTTKNYSAVYTTERTYTTTSRTTSNTAATSKKTTTRKKTTTKKDKYNIYDYNDPEDFYEDNYDDFLDYEDAEDYYLQLFTEIRIKQGPKPKMSIRKSPCLRAFSAMQMVGLEGYGTILLV